MSTAGDIDLTKSKQPQLRVLLIAMMIVPTVVVLIRAWSRALLPVSPLTRIPTKFWWDDWMAFFGAAIDIAVCGIGLKLIDLGMGLHIQAVPPENVEKFLKLLWIIYYIFDTGTAVSKSSALFFYARIFSISKFKYALWVVHAMNVGWLVGILISVTFMCNPIQKAWDVSLPGTCLNTGRLWLGSGLVSLIIDVIILVMPLPMLWKLKMKTIRRIQISGVFICGYLVIVVSIGRLVTIVQAGNELQEDPTYNTATPTLWLGSEIAISLVSISLPSVFFLAQHVHIKDFWSVVRSHIHSFKSSLPNTGHRPHGADDHGLMFHPHNYPYMPQTKKTAESGGLNDSTESTGYDGIQVVRNVEVA